MWPPSGDQKGLIAQSRCNGLERFGAERQDEETRNSPRGPGPSGRRAATEKASSLYARAMELKRCVAQRPKSRRKVEGDQLLRSHRDSVQGGRREVPLVQSGKGHIV